MIISREVYNQITKLKLEDCGFMYGSGRLSKIHKIKNISKDKNSFKMSTSGALSFLFKNLLYFFKKDFVFAQYHIHSVHGYVSKEDIKYMIQGINYVIIYKNKIFMYRKEKEKIRVVYYEFD